MIAITDRCGQAAEKCVTQGPFPKMAVYRNCNPGFQTRARVEMLISGNALPGGEFTAEDAESADLRALSLNCSAPSASSAVITWTSALNLFFDNRGQRSAREPC